jgi:phage shock protein PspC (stress-responsive transcriptional regulator)
MKRLYRSRTNSTIGGVCGGIGEYFNVDPTFVRIIAVLLFFAKGVGLLAYIVGWIIIPQRPLAESEDSTPEEPPGEQTYSPWTKYLPGAILILIGVLFLAHDYYWWWSFEDFWPVLLIIVGIVVLFRSGQRAQKESKEQREQTNESS